MPTLADYVAAALRKGVTKEELRSALAQKGYTSAEISAALRAADGPEPRKNLVRPSGRTYNMLDKVGMLFSRPTEFFREVRDASIGPSLALYATVGLIVAAVTIGLSFLLSTLRMSSFGGIGYFSVFLGAGLSTALFIIGFVGTFVYAGIVHMCAKGMKGIGTYTDTYTACVYSLIPAMLLSIIPYIGWLSFIYAIVLMTIGLAEYHQISKGKAVFLALIPVVIAAVVIGLFVAYLVMSLSRAF